MKTTREKLYRRLGLAELKTQDDGNTGTFEGYLAYFDNEDKSDDVIERGAFTKTIQESKLWMQSHKKTFLLPILWQHDRNVVLGGFTDAVEDSKGLYVKGLLDISTNDFGIPNNVEATKAYSGLKVGYIDEMSIGYYVIKREFKGGTRYLKELSVFEGSLATTGMACNPEALVTGVKMSTQDKKAIDFTTRLEVMRSLRAEQKDFNSRLADTEAQDCLSDWYDLSSCLRQTTIDLFTMGDSPASDAEAAMAQFSVAYMAYVARCQAANLSDYLATQAASGSQYNYLGYMTRPDNGENKTGKALSTKNMTTLKTAVAGIKTHNDSIQELLDEYNIANDNSNKTIEPVQATHQVEPPQGTPIAEIKSNEPTNTEEDYATKLLEDMRLYLATNSVA